MKLDELFESRADLIKFAKDKRNVKLTSLNGAPKVVGGSFDTSGVKLTSLPGLNMEFHNKNLTSLHNIHKEIGVFNGTIDFRNNKIKSCVLGLLKIEQLKKVFLDNEEVQKIINKYLPEGDIVECQQELIEAGFDVYAQL